MSQTAITMASVMKDIWTAERLQKQFEDKNAPLGRIESVRGVMIGNQAQVPIHAGRAGSFTTVGAAGGALNPATGQPVTQGLYTLPYNWFQVELETSALLQASGSNLQAIVGAKDLTTSIGDGSVHVAGNTDDVQEFLALLDTFQFWFNIVTP